MCNIQSALRTTWRKPRGVGRKKNLLRGPVLDPRAKQTYQKRGQEGIPWIEKMVPWEGPVLASNARVFSECPWSADTRKDPKIFFSWS